MTAIKTEADRTRWLAYIGQQELPIEVSCAPWKSKRSNEQNAYLFGVCYRLISDATGYDVDDIHEYALGRMYGWADKKRPKTPRTPEGIESVPVRTTTTDADGKRSVLTKAEFSAFVEAVQKIGSQAGVFIPDPE